ncbi:MAG: HAD family hydrolase [Rhodothermales bacterium]
MKRAVFLDRDGTIIVDRHYLREPSGVELLPGAAKAIGILHDLGLAVVLTSNQSGIGRGYITEKQHTDVHAAFIQHLGRYGLTVDAAYYCPHVPNDRCSCRKPNAGMLVTAATDLGLSLRGSFMIGDRMSDVEAGRRAGCRTGWVRTDPDREVVDTSASSHGPDFVGDNLLAAAYWIERQLDGCAATQVTQAPGCDP